ncbi:MAG: hypothetical protein KC501_16765, partial [Myxococcales bacterium]|nr:hypothetical protein [Myxococcales bacterium]
MPSKLVTDRQKSAAAVIAAARTHGSQAAEAISTTLGPHLAKAEDRPDVELLLELSTRALETAITTLVQADTAHEAELSDDAGPRRQRDELATALYDDLIELKEVATGLLGRGALQPLRLEGTTPRDPTVLVRHAEGVIEALRSAELPKSRVRGAKLHTDEWAQRLSEHTEALSSTLGDVARELREAEATLVAKNQALAEHDRTFGDVATLISAVLRMGGQTELAARVRPSPRRPGRTVAVAEGEGEPASPEA